MTSLKVAFLTDRGVVRVSGADAAKLLQGLITTDLDLLESQPAIFSGLLTPQGKILFDFFVVKTEQGYLLETRREQTGDLIKRLTFYKLRANVAIEEVSDKFGVAAFWGDAAPEVQSSIIYADPRLAELGWRAIVPADQAPADVSGTPTSAADYHVHRVALGIPEGGRDYKMSDTFPHEALFDQLGGVSFEKGCYVGQEVVSRVQHRSTARKRVVPIASSAQLEPGAEVKAGEAVIGTVGSVADTRGLALLRIDRVGEALEKGQPLTAGGIPIAVELPAWAGFSIPTREGAAKV